jgi:hypothetical protein
MALQWRALKYGDGYEISEYGEVRRTRPKQSHKKQYGLFLKQGTNGRNYRKVVLTLGPKRYKMFYVHRLVCEHFHGPQPSPDHEVAHYDRNTKNNHYSNLRWATKSENQRDRHRHGTMPGQPFYGARLWAE